MKSWHVSAVLSLALSLSVRSAPLDATYVIHDGGQRRTFVVASDQIHQRRELKRLPFAGTIEEARAAAAQSAEADLPTIWMIMAPPAPESRDIANSHPER